MINVFLRLGFKVTNLGANKKKKGVVRKLISNKKKKKIEKL